MDLRAPQEQGIFSFIKEFSKNMIFPCVMYFYVVPALFGPEKTINYETESASWTSFFVKLFLGIITLFILTLLMLYLKQDSIIFKPS